MTKTLCEIITKYEDNVSLETIRRSFKHMDEFLHKHKHVIKEEDYHELMEKMEDIFCPYLIYQNNRNPIRLDRDVSHLPTTSFSRKDIFR